MYYYKTKSTWCFEEDERHLSKREGEAKYTELKKKKRELIELCLDSPIDYIVIKNKFFDPGYWAGRQWQDEMAI